jgi:hypothetical protein
MFTHDENMNPLEYVRELCIGEEHKSHVVIFLAYVPSVAHHFHENWYEHYNKEGRRNFVSSKFLAESNKNMAGTRTCTMRETRDTEFWVLKCIVTDIERSMGLMLR